jgi:hypothetical protein
MAFKIVNGKLVLITDQSDFGTPEQKAAGKTITGTLGNITKSPTAPTITSTPQQITLGSAAPAVAPPPAPVIQAGGNTQQVIQQQQTTTLPPLTNPFVGSPLVNLTGAPMQQVAPLQTPVVSFTGAPMLEAPAPVPIQQPRSIAEALSMGAPGSLRFFAGGSQAADARTSATQLAPPAVPQQESAAAGTLGAAGGGFAGDLSDPASQEALRQLGGRGAIQTFENIIAGNSPAWITPAQVQFWIDTFDDIEGSVEDVATALGYRFNSDTGLWERLDPIEVGGSGGGRTSAGTARVPRRSTRGPGGTSRGSGGFTSGGLINWRIG